MDQDSEYETRFIGEWVAASEPIPGIAWRLGADVSESGRSRTVLATKMFVDMIQIDMRDPRNQGPNFDASTFPIGDLTAAFISGDEVIGASEGDLEHAKSLAEQLWAEAWGILLERPVQ